jgi:hypothetical protein
MGEAQQITEPVLLKWLSFSSYRSHLETRYAHSLLPWEEFIALRTNLQAAFIATRKNTVLEQRECMCLKIYFQLKLVVLHNTY